MADTALFGNGCTSFVFSWRNQKISDYLNCTEIGLVPTGLSLQDTAEHPGVGGAVLGKEPALHIQRRWDKDFIFQVTLWHATGI